MMDLFLYALAGFIGSAVAIGLSHLLGKALRQGKDFYHDQEQ